MCEKATYRTDQTNVPDALPQRHHLCSVLVAVCAHAVKAAVPLFGVKGNQQRAETQ